MAAKYLTSALLVAAASFAESNRLDPRADSKIQWGACNTTIVNTTLPSECADFTVPLDYTTPSSKETIKLQIARIKAAVQPAKGTILLNFGGPGSDGRATLAGQAPLLRNLSGGEYNLAAFDPRGTVNTIPEVCYTSVAEIKKFVVAERTWYDATSTTLAQMWKQATTNAEACYAAHKKTQRFLGTGSVARDLISVVDALGEDGMLRYWGFSYGTTLGATVASMFPERIDKLIIDGVQNPHEYYHADADFEEWSDSDRVFSEVFLSCVKAGPTLCPFASANMTGEQLEKTAWKLTEQLKTNPIPVKGGASLTYAGMRGFFADAVYGPNSWGSLATLLALIASNRTQTPAFYKVYEAMDFKLNSTLVTYPPLYGIHCSDKTVRLKSLDEFRPVQERLSKISKVMDGTDTDVSMTCAQWKSDAAGPYKGDFHVKTKNPILLATNKYDGHTPIRSAVNVSSGFEGSGMLVVNGFGHTTLAQPSVCTIEQTVAYWHNRTLPAKGFVCEVDGAPYSTYTWDNATAAYSRKSNAMTFLFVLQ
ncbi:nedd8-like protein [Purpureocillium lavendulum]|uniref:Nedd8-like protein n=1 Tax=Purpureocillium lavendulum TaxID=1247861 RepID=A0AB34FK46_9HYPO|nr:nedd8-like protein [Purpureocillium lavendulum]